MRIIARPKIRDFQAAHPEAADWLDAWWREVKKSNWFNFADVRQRFKSVDKVRNCYVFNLPGANRLIVRMQFARRKCSDKVSVGFVYIRYILTHKEYEQGKWKKEC